MSTKLFLLPNLEIMCDSSVLIDKIHQYILSPPKKNILSLLEQSISYTDEHLDQNSIKELFILIYSCISQFPNQPDKFFTEIYTNALESKNKLIIFVMIFSLNNKLSSIPAAQTLFSDIEKQILEYVKSPKDKFVISNYEIDEIYKADFISDTILAINLTEVIVSTVYPYIFSLKNFSKDRKSKLIEKVSNSKLIKFLPAEILTYNNVLKSLTQENLSVIIPKTSDQIFSQILPILSEYFSDLKNCFKPFISSILDKIVEFNIDINQIDFEDQIFYNLDGSMIKTNYWDFFSEHDIILDDRISREIREFPDKVSVLNVINKYDNVPLNIILKGLFEYTEFHIFEKFADSDLNLSECENSEVCCKKEFWIHVFSVISNPVYEYSKNLLFYLATIFKKNVNKENLYEYYDAMIFDKFPTKKIGNNFLFDLLNEFNSEYKANFNKNLNILLNKTIETKIIPLPSFWLLFDYDFLSQFYNTEKMNPIVLYAYQFCHCSGSMNNIETLIIQENLNEENEKFIIDFIKSRDFNKLINLNDDLLSFFVSVIIFINQETKSNIEGLTKENVLPFVTLSFILMEKFGGNFLIKSSEFKNLILDSCELASKSSNTLIIESINSLVSFYHVIFSLHLFPNEITFDIFNSFFVQIVNNTYKADKTILIDTFFKFARLEYFRYSIYSRKTDVQCLYEKNAINLFKFTFRNLKRIENFDQINYKLNFSVLTKTKIKSILNELIKKSSIYEETVNLVYFLENYCQNVPKLTIKDYSNLNKVINKTLEKKDWTNFLSLYGFMKKNDTQNLSYYKYHISNEIERSYISYLLKIPQIETKENVFDFLFHILMKDASTSNYYFTALLEKICYNYTIEPDTILSNYTNEYKIYGDLFTKAIQNSYNRFIYKSKDVFVRNFYSLSYKPKQPLIINKLLNEVEKNPNNCNAFICLLNIASSFPFLFNKVPIEIFNMVLHPLDSFSLIFLNSNENQKIKIALASLYFLYSCLYSVKILEKFIPWILNRIKSFTSSQILAFSFILFSLFITKKVKKVMLASFSKYKFVNTALDLLKKEIKEEKIYKLYKTNIFKLLLVFYFELNDLLNKKKIVLINEMAKSEKPVSLMFNKKLTILGDCLMPLDLPIPFNNEINEFDYAITKPKKIYLNYNNNDLTTIETDKTNKFLTHFMKNKATDDIDIPKTELIRSISICAKEPYWVYQYIAKEKKIPLKLYDYNYLKNITEDIIKLNIHYVDDVSYISYNKIGVEFFFIDDLHQEEFYNLLIKEIELNNNDKVILDLFKVVTKNKSSAYTIIKIVTDFIDNNLDKIESIKKILKAFDHVDVELFYANFQDGVKKLINCALKPEIRVDITCISYILKILSLFDFVNWRASYLLGFHLILGTYKVLPQIATFCKKFNERLLEDIMNLIEKAFDELIKKEGLSNQNVALVLEGIPSLIKKNMSLAPLLIDQLFARYNKGDRFGINMITMLMNAITPDRNEDEIDEIDFSLNGSSSVSTRNSSRSSSRMLKQAPQNLVKNNPEFWGLYSKYRDTINKIILNDHGNITRFKLLTNFPELVNFDIRMVNFRRNLTNKINKNYEINFYIRRSNVLVDSFEQLNELSKTDWLSKFRIQFVDEKGADYGGLTKEWFTLIIQELLNPNFALFIKVENQSYQPNPFSGINKEHIEYFRFAGKIIALAIIKEQCVNAHFTRSFRRQILHTQLKLNDYEDIDREIFNSMKLILEGDADPLCLNFTIDDDEYGVIKTVPLKENGDEIDVTNENKTEYVSLYINYRLRKSISKQVTAFCDGFNWLIPQDEIRLFSQSELDLIICGIPKIDVDDLRENTVYNHPYNKNHAVIKMFFNVISKWNSDNLAKFLIFLTGSSQVPVNGFKDYKERGNPIRISPGGDKNRLCVAHTCFNTLDLPEYDNEDDLNRKLLLAVQECNEFALA